MRNLCNFLSVVMLGAFTGCGGMGQVDGKLVWEDGSPATELAGSQVVFEMPEKHLSARGEVDANGGFKLRTEVPGDGAPVGDYVVAIVEFQKSANAAGTVLMPPILDEKYRSTTNSGLTAKVSSGVTPVTLKLSKLPKK